MVKSDIIYCKPLNDGIIDKKRILRKIKFNVQEDSKKERFNSDTSYISEPFII